MDDTSFQVHANPASESPYDLRSGAGLLAANLRRVSGAWRMPSTWRATTNLLLWLGLSCARALVAVAGLLASLERDGGPGWEPRSGPQSCVCSPR